MKRFNTRRARIVRDTYAGYEVQVWRLWWPFWCQPITNTHGTIADAEDFAKKWLEHVIAEVTL